MAPELRENLMRFNRLLTLSIIILSDVALHSVARKTCFMDLQPDSSNGGVHRWALPSDTDVRCSCTKILAKPAMPSCGFLNDLNTDGFWFTDNPGILADRKVWNTEKLKFLLGCLYKDTDECSPNPCLHNGTCHDNLFAFNCSCRDGYDGNTCEIDIDECFSNPCLHNGTCHEKLFAFNCSCTDGYEGNTCEIDTDECSPNPCLHKGTCYDQLFAFNCSCTDGYEGNTCEIDTDECFFNPCLHNGTCYDQLFAFNCSCTDGYEGNTCEIDIDECSPNPCLHNGTCYDQLFAFSCSCIDGYEGNTCEIDIDECSPNPCLHNGTCYDQLFAFSCSCKDGYEGNTCEINIDECSPNPCLHNGTCYDQLFAFNCSCTDGYEGNTCEIDTNECFSNPCLHNGTCHDQLFAFNCSCTDGYEGNTCEIDIDDCHSQPCCNGGVCIDHINHYECACAQGYKGTTCLETVLPRSCEELSTEILSSVLQNNSTHIDWEIDPDGPGGVRPFNVTCNPRNGKTKISHDLEENHHVSGYEEPGSYIKKITYTASLEQMIALIDISIGCQQKILIKCKGATFGSDLKYHWWQNRHGDIMYNWGSPAGTVGCACSIQEDCEGGGPCNCNINDAGKWQQDGGWLTDNEHLPVTAISISETGLKVEEAEVTLGRLICTKTRPLVCS